MAINDVVLQDTFLNFVNKTNQAIDVVNSQITEEQLQKLNTNDKTTLVNAINEILKRSLGIDGGTVEGNLTTTGYLASNISIKIGSNNNGDSVIQLYDDKRNVFKELKWNVEKDELTIEDNNGNHNKILHEKQNINCSDMEIDFQLKSLLKAVNGNEILKSGEVVYLRDVKRLAYHDGETRGGYIVPAMEDLNDLAKVKVSNTDTTADYINTKIVGGTGIYTEKFNGASNEILKIQSGLRAGLVNFWPGTTSSIPLGWVLCDGRALDRTKYEELFSVLGIRYGVGDGKTTFNVPDYRGKFLFGVDDNTQLNTSGGEKQHTLTIDEMPSHNHNLRATPNSGNRNASETRYLGSGTDNSKADRFWSDDYMLENRTAVVNAGKSLPHNNMPPYTSGYWIIFTNVFQK